MEAESLGSVLVKDSLEAVNQVFMVFVAVKHVKAGQNKLVFFSYKAVKEFNIVFVFEVIPRKAVHKLQQLLLVFGNWRQWSV